MADNDEVPAQGARRDPDQNSQLDTGNQQGSRHHVEVALETAEAGWPVFPCRPDKTPATHNGFKDATESPTRIEAWWAGHPEYLVAVPTEGLVVVDLDEPHTGPTGETWAWWCHHAEPHGWDPTVAPIVATPRGGVHIYFRQPDGADVRCSTSKLASGVDIRANGGYVIVPGSVLPDGREYELLSPYPRALVDAPRWLIDACTKPDSSVEIHTSPPTVGCTRYGLQALQSELGRLALATDGTRNATLNKAAFRAGQLVAGGQLDAHYAHDQLVMVALRIGLGETETEATIESGMTKGALTPRRPAA
jgi:Bifunctional DNA primase/polymerase, N-terminal